MYQEAQRLFDLGEALSGTGAEDGSAGFSGVAVEPGGLGAGVSGGLPVRRLNKLPDAYVCPPPSLNVEALSIQVGVPRCQLDPADVVSGRQ